MFPKLTLTGRGRLADADRSVLSWMSRPLAAPANHSGRHPDRHPDRDQGVGENPPGRAERWVFHGRGAGRPAPLLSSALPPKGKRRCCVAQEFAIRKLFQREGLALAEVAAAPPKLYQYVILRCVIGSRPTGWMRRNRTPTAAAFYLPPADLHWSLYGVPEQLENPSQRRSATGSSRSSSILALKANPNVLECLYTPLVEHVTPLAQELLAMRAVLPVAAGLPDLQRLRAVAVQEAAAGPAQPRRGEVEARHAPDPPAALRHHRPAGRRACRCDVGEHRERLLAIRRGELPWEEVDALAAGPAPASSTPPSRRRSCRSGRTTSGRMRF